ncbi:MAG: YicC/YloC family endoribonuclease [Gammaproteobacteria bacterium]
MTYSMTAFARHIESGKLGQYTWEIRSVNHRYSEIFIRLPEELRGLETTIRERFSKRVKRGKIDCNLRFEPSSAASGDLVIDESQLEKLSAACGRIHASMPDLSSFTAIDILKWPGIVDNEKIAVKDMESEALLGFDQALEQLVDTRKREGEKLALVINQRCSAIADIVKNLRTRVPEIIESIKSRHKQRIAELDGDFDPTRVEQECALLMQKLDVDEELDRLDAHLSEVAHVLSTGQPSGRRLDFLMQELNREANTVGSKSAHIDTANASVDLKVFIEQMREQIQNLE